MARIQKIESDSSFNLSNVLEGKILTYKTFENGRVVHKAKLHDGSVVQITPDLSPLQASIDTKITAPAAGTAGQFLQKTSDSTQWADINLDNYYTKNDIDGFIENISNSLSYLNGKFDNYYTKYEVNGLIEGLASDSFNQSLINRVASLQTHQYIGQGAIKVTQESSSTLFSLAVDSNAFSNTSSGLSSLLTIKQLSNSLSSFAATYQLQGADGNPIGDKINIPNGGYQIGKGLKLSGSQLSLQSDSNTDTNKFLSIRSDTIGLKGITEAINEAVSSYTQLPPIGFPGQFLQKTSDSLQWAFVDLSNYYTIAEVDALWSGSDSTSYVPFITITEVTDNKIYLQGLQIPIGIQTSLGNYYPIEKGSLQLGSDSVTISIAPYLAYDNMSTFQAPWVVWMASSLNSGQGSNPNPDTIYTKIQVNALLRQKYDVSDASLLQRLTYSNAYNILDLQSNKMDTSDAQQLFNSIRQVPSGGTTGQFLQKGSNAYQWADVDLQNYYTKDEVDALILGISDSIDLSDYYTKEEIDQKFDDLAEQVASNSAIVALENRLTIAEAAILLKQDASNASDAYSTLQAAIDTKITNPEDGSQGYFLMKTSQGTAWTELIGATWQELPWTANIELTAANGALQRLVLLGNTDITEPILSVRTQQLTLQIVKSSNAFTVTINNVTISASQTMLLGWYWDGIATRRLPNIYLGD